MCLSTGGLARNPGMYPDWELNHWPSGSQDGTQATEPHQPGPILHIIAQKILNLKKKQIPDYHTFCFQLYSVDRAHKINLISGHHPPSFRLSLVYKLTLWEIKRAILGRWIMKTPLSLQAEKGSSRTSGLPLLLPHGGPGPVLPRVTPEPTRVTRACPPEPTLPLCLCTCFYFAW